MLHIFPTSRMVRDFYLDYKEDGFLPDAMSIANFESYAVLVDGLKLASKDRRVLIMQEACKFENFKKLHIPDEFLAFLSNSSYIFRFFEELAVEKKSIDELRNADVYAEYAEHLDILQELFKRYTTLLKSYGFYDNITLPTLYKINKEYLKRYKTINLYVEGFLNRFEWELFKHISSFLQVHIYLHVNKYNQKMRDMFLDNGICIKENGYVKVSLNDKSYTLLSTPKNRPEITCKNFFLRSLQAGYIYEQIDNFVKDGIEPEDIVVVLPDESFAPILKAYDKAHNLNFAMGFSFSQSKIFQTLQAIEEAIFEDSPLTRERIKYFCLDEKMVDFKNSWSNVVKYEHFEKLLDSLELEFSSSERVIFQNELYHISIILKEVKLKLSQIFKLFLQRLSKVSLDDVSGGRVVVMGVLETRGAQFKGVIIPDFNDEFVPRYVSKDMFLSSSIREHAKLPSLKDRENLQRYYYHRLIENAKRVSISYVKNDVSMPSRFLQNLHVKNDDRYNQNSYASLLFDKKELKPTFYCEDLTEKNTLFLKPLSSSKLKYFLTCKRGYYHRYIQNIDDKDLPSDELGANHIGEFLHDALLELYQNKTFFNDAKTLHNALSDILYVKHHPKALWLLEREVWKKKLFRFCENEIKRFEDGWMPYVFEEVLEYEINGVKFFGKIDRIDKHKNGSFCVIDYKSGKINMEKKIENQVDFQLQFYFLLAKQKYKNVQNAGFYDLNSGDIVWEEQMEQKCDKLFEILNELKNQKEINYSIEDKDCAYSPYNILLGRE